SPVVPAGRVGRDRVHRHQHLLSAWGGAQHVQIGLDTLAELGRALDADLHSQVRDLQRDDLLDAAVPVADLAVAGVAALTTGDAIGAVACIDMIRAGPAAQHVPVPTPREHVAVQPTVKDVATSAALQIVPARA